ncbi:MAG TPA: hypothetical protein VNO33_08380, partial [Kofleriaceae bacterium]|nr:hypothetical protein [Kofleriaceae bacterium]
DGRIVRNHLFAVRARGADVWPREGQPLGWFEPAALPPDLARVVPRSFACLQEPARGTAEASPGERAPDRGG